MDSGSGQDKHLALAVDPRPVVGWAVGILMETLGFDLEEACRRLAQCAQSQRRDPSIIAAEILVTRRLPAAC